ncbi:MAG: hypothetical protein PHP98_01855, partial [Kiritimatiellae bacterium]|nr:hypothetical protein [Kiritimatiellia bacterium]
ALLSILVYYPDVADDFDVWWHLKYGRHFVRHLTWTIDHTAFSWTPSDPGWIYVSWLGSSLLYLFHLAGGYPALVVLQWLIFLAVTGLFLLFLRSCGSPLSAVHIAGLLLVFTAINPVAVYIKPELFTLLFFTMAVFVYFVSKATAQNYFWIYPPLFLVWVNTHGGFINGLGFITIALAAEAASYAFKHPDRMLKPLLWKFAAGVGLAYAAALINPHGVVYWIQIFQNAAQSGSHIASVAAYSPPWNYLFPGGFFFRRINAAWAMILMALVLATIAGAGLMRKKQLSPPVLALNLAFFMFGFSVFRASIYFCILWIFSCHYLGRFGQWRMNAPAAVAAFLFSLAVSGMIVYETAVYNTYNSRFGARIADYIPAASADFIAQNKLPGPLFNDYLSGGYLVWALPPPYKVFIDPRYGPYVSAGVWQDYLALMTGGGLRMLDDKYRCNTALVMNGNRRLIDRFLKSPEWGLAYFDAAGAVFLRQSCLNTIGTRWFKGDMRPEKFSGISNPRILTTVFYLYCHYNPLSARKILACYKNNVRKTYKFRSFEIERMEAALNQLPIP